MNDELTPKQREIIIKHKLTNMVNISMPDWALYADFYQLYVDNRDRYNNFSDIAREAFRCLLAIGVDWRVNVGSNGKLDEILSKLNNLRVVAETASDERLREEVKKQLDDSEGFFK